MSVCQGPFFSGSSSKWKNSLIVETLWDEPFQEEKMMDFVLKDRHQQNFDLPMRYTPLYFGQSRRGVLHWQQQSLQYYLDQEFIWKSTYNWCEVNELDKFGKVNMDSHLKPQEPNQFNVARFQTWKVQTLLSNDLFQVDQERFNCYLENPETLYKHLDRRGRLRPSPAEHTSENETDVIVTVYTISDPDTIVEIERSTLRQDAPT